MATTQEQIAVYIAQKDLALKRYELEAARLDERIAALQAIDPEPEQEV